MKGLAAACAVSAALLCGCGRAVIACGADEVRASSWSVSEGDVSASLTFSGDCARLSIKSGSESTELEGLCVIGDSELIILDETDKYCFDYRLTGSTLTLLCGKDSVTLSKDKG